MIKPRMLSMLVLVLAACVSAEETLPEWRVKRKEVFEFVAKPSVTRKGDRVEISFTSKDTCDVTVAIENSDGQIVRHLASGVLGENAPPPLKAGSLEQSLVWDGKDDQGKYIDDKDSLIIRISLGLAPKFEKDLFNEPKRRQGREAPILQATPDGVYIYDGGNGLDFVELYGHDGAYVRTVYPFPADKIDQVNGLHLQTYPQDGKMLPVKPTFLQQTFLTCGNNYSANSGINAWEPQQKYASDKPLDLEGNHYGMYGKAASFFSTNGERIALGMVYLNRFCIDGTSGGMDIEGPLVCLGTTGKGLDNRGMRVPVPARASAMSPDGKTLYLAGYNFCHLGRASADIITGMHWESYHCVLKMDTAGDERPELFAGKISTEDAPNTEGFKVPACLATDKAGRVYVGDYLNNRVQIFEPDGKFLKSLKVDFPAQICIDGKTQEIYVFSNLVYHAYMAKMKTGLIKGEVTVFGSFDKPDKIATYDLPQQFQPGMPEYQYSGTGFPVMAAVDGYGKEPLIWLAREWKRENVLTRKQGASLFTHNIQIFRMAGKKLEQVDDFAKDVQTSVHRLRPAEYNRQRLQVNPKTGKLYVAEGATCAGKAFKDLIEIDPASGNIKIVDIPFDAEDFCFDHDGLVYLRNLEMVARFDAKTWREVPWDYGEEVARAHTSFSSDRKEHDLISGLYFPGGALWHHDGMYVNLLGSVVIGAKLYEKGRKSRLGEAEVAKDTRFHTDMYPGRLVPSEGAVPLFHIFNKHGERMYVDAIPGIMECYGVGMDSENNLYTLCAGTRIVGSKKYHNILTGTVVKARPGVPKIITVGKGTPIPLSEDQEPKRPPDMMKGGKIWGTGIEWYYGAVGYSGKNAGVGCSCWNCRMAFDYFNRSFAPEVERYSVAVIDGNGNLILRLGGYGNRDSGTKVKAGGDEIGLMTGAYLATDTDKRLFIADASNDRIISVKLDYHVSEIIALKNVPGEKE